MSKIFTSIKDFVLVQIVVGEIPTLPLEGISVLLANQLDEVIMNPIFYDEPSYEENKLKYTEMYPACVVTTAMIMKHVEDETLLQDGSTETRVIELNHILFAHVNGHFVYGDVWVFYIYTDQNPSYLLTN